MAQNISLLGASYTDVPSVLLPKTGGGTAQFDDTTDANASAEDIADGKTAYVNGVKVVGTGSGGGGTTQSITLYDGSAIITSDNPNYIWMNNMPEEINVGDKYRFTWNGTQYTKTAVYDSIIGSTYGNTVGNPAILNGNDDGSNAPFCAFKYPSDPNVMVISTTGSGTITLKIEKIVEGGGSGTSNYVTGTVTLTSNLSLTTSAQNIPNLQLPFQPDMFWIIADRDSFEDRESYSGGLWSVFAIKKSLVMPFASSTSATPETVTTNDYAFFTGTSLNANSSVTCGYGLANFGNALNASYYGRFLINANGTVSVGRYSTSSSTKMYAGVYRYFACKV